MKVRALKQGYFDHRRIKPGDVFDMPEEIYQPVDKDGKPLFYKPGTPKAGQRVTCSWVELLEPKAKVEPQDKPVGRGKKAKHQSDDDVVTQNEVI